jgi:hypothetical protein
MQTLTQKVTTTLNEFKNDKGKVKQALGATGAVMLFAGGMYGLQTLLKNKPKPVIKYLSPAMSHYLQYNEDWYNQIAALSDYGHFALSSFEKLAEAVAFLIYLTSDLENEKTNFSKLYMVAQLIGVVVECVRVLRAHLQKQYSQVLQVMLEFDEIAANIQQLCNDTQYNVDNILHYQRLTK